MPPGLIQDQDNLCFRSGLFTDKVQMRIHIIGVDGRCNEGRGSTGFRVDGAEEIDPLIFGLLDGCRPGSSFGPDCRQRSLLADPRFVLEPDFDGLIGVFIADLLDKRGTSLSHCCIAWGLFLRCLGRGFRQDSPRRCRRS